MGSELKNVKIRFDGVSIAEANVKAGRLREEILEAVPEMRVDVVKDDPTTQDFGATLVLLLGAPAVVALAKGIADYLSRDRGTITIDVNGKVAATGLSGADAARIAEALRGKAQ